MHYQFFAAIFLFSQLWLPTFWRHYLNLPCFYARFEEPVRVLHLISYGEARTGIEPVHGGFADPCVTASPPRQFPHLTTA